MAGPRARSARRDRRRSNSQNFLRSRELARDLVREARVGTADFVLEIGAGDGRLTAELAALAGRVHAIELDPYWADRLRRRFEGAHNVLVVEGDALGQPLPREPFRVLANVPFDRTTAVLRHLLDDPLAPLERADLIVEWGAACKRARVWPSTMLGVCWGAWYVFSIARRLPSEAFVPQPTVAAGLLTIARRAAPLVPPEEAQHFRRFVSRGFRHGLRSVVRPATARELDAHQWADLYRAARAVRRPH